MAAKENERGAVMGKLVRDKIPEIIKNDGKTPIIEILSNEDYLKELDKKLNEEVTEYQADKSIEEMADVLEVLFAICEGRGHTVEELMQETGMSKNRILEAIRLSGDNMEYIEKE